MPSEPTLDDLRLRLERLEAEVAALKAAAVLPAPPRSAPPPLAASAPPPRPPRPAPRPPAQPFNPTVLIAAAGAGIFLLGAIFFLLLAIQRGWIGPELRVVLGILVGAGLTAGAARLLLRGSRALGICLLPAGMGTLLFTFWAGAGLYHLYAMSLGFAAVGAVVLLAGGLAARARSGGALAVALICGLLAPAVFGEGGHHEVNLSLYLLLLLGAATAVPYLTGAGGRWRAARWIAVLGVWAYLGFATSDPLRESVRPLMALLLAHQSLTGIWIWLPRQAEKRPSTPTLLWFLVSLAATTLSAVYWRALNYPLPWFSLVVLGFGALNLALVRPLRARLGSRQADLGLLVLAAGHLALAVPIALEWRWVGPLWGAFALGLAWAAGRAEDLPDWDAEEARHLLYLALGMVVLATGRWTVHALSRLDRVLEPWNPALSSPPFLNSLFALGLLAAGAWLLLARRGGSFRPLGLLAAEALLNLGLAFEMAALFRRLDFGARTASIAITLVWALSGVGQWLASLLAPPGPWRRGLGVAGLAWLAVASAKLILGDMAQADTALRALAFLAVGALLLGAALVGHKVRGASPEAP